MRLFWRIWQSVANLVYMLDLVNLVVEVIGHISIIIWSDHKHQYFSRLRSIYLWRPILEIFLLDDFLWCTIAYRHHHHLHSHHLWSSPCPTYRRNPQWASLLLWWVVLLTWHTSPASPGSYTSKSASTSVCSATSRRRLAPVAIPSGSLLAPDYRRNAGCAELGENRATRIKKSSEALHGCICVRWAS